LKDKIDILLTNDDGIAAPGLFALFREMKKLGEVTIVAPDSEQSAVGHAITLSDPLRVWEFYRDDELYGYAVNGTPADCVKLALKAILKERPRLIVSGINQGVNTGINVIYSGTVSAATEGTINEIPSIAISLASFTKKNFDFAASFARRLAFHVIEKGLPKGTFLNVNIPPLSPEKIKGIAVTRQGLARFEEFFVKRVDPKNRVYYWMDGEKVQLEEADDVDDRVVKEDKISITPIQYDMTNYGFMDELRKWDFLVNK